ncbi:MAG: hypothetical protein KA746_00475 [Pyrinomonadaceae bacterium]|nr:hypothetical protein [Pyrinomonadaceae bacterium]
MAFIVLAVFYPSLPNEIVVTRGLFGSPDTLAPKSLFTVFRVPLIDAICAAALAILIRRFSHAGSDLVGFWRILLYTAACKTLLQAIEIASPGQIANVFFVLTLALVLTGIFAAFYLVRHDLKGLYNGLGKFSVGESLALAVLLIAYLGIGIVPLFIY